ncbi:MAG: His Kinase A (phospho-acceptor) domain/GAF domain/Histidine kinase-, DNA gyrase B-, and HSP90-like A [Phormidium sp. OSCR]|nr:MAG: His Kinase A (phospho-acceptor) domain/GAF domain/Histidine kinase-, DNA gyrase B-, and HSP90-like A [Phormidium sp. OSCR]
MAPILREGVYHDGRIYAPTSLRRHHSTISMSRSLLQKLFSQADIKTTVQQLSRQLRLEVAIEDTRGKIVFTTASKNDEGWLSQILSNVNNKGNKPAPIESSLSLRSQTIDVNGKTLGWLHSDNDGTVLHQVVTCLARQQSEKTSLARELLERYQEIDLFYEISTQVTASLDLNQLAQLVLREVENTLPSSGCAIWLLDEDDRQLRLLSQLGMALPWSNPLALDQTILGAILAGGQGEIVNNVACDRRSTSMDRPISSLLCVPLHVQSRIIGLMAVVHNQGTIYDAEHLKLLTLFSVQTAIAIDKALLYQQSRRTALNAQKQAQQLQDTLEELQQAQAHLVQSEKMSSLGQMVAGIAHEINNPVNFINGNLDHARNYTQDLLELIDLYAQCYPQAQPEIEDLIQEIDLGFIQTDLPKLIRSMKMGIERIQEIVRSLKNFSRIDRDRPQLADLHVGLDSTLLILNHRIKAKGDRPEVQINCDYQDLPEVECYAGQLNQVFINTVANAIDAMEEANIEHPTLWLRTKLQDNRWVVVEIADNGPGMSEEVRSQIYDPFFTTKALGKGTGLGLAISRQIIVEKHYGRLLCDSCPGGGTLFSIWIPLSPDLGEPPSTSHPEVESLPLTNMHNLNPSESSSTRVLDDCQKLMERLALENPNLQDMTADDIYEMFTSIPILLKLYRVLINSPFIESSPPS